MPPLTFCALEPEQDLTSFVALLNSIAAEKGETQDLTEEAQREQVRMLEEAGIRTNRFVAEAGGAIVGFVEVWKIPETLRVPLMIGVHPRWRIQNVGEQLLAHAQQRAKGLGATAFLTYAKPDDAWARAFFPDNSFVCVSGYRKMSTELTSSPAQPEWSETLRVSTYAEVNQPHIITEASGKGWGDLWGHTTPTDQTTAAVLEAYPPESIFLLFSGEEVVGICKVEEVESDDGTLTGIVDAPGIAPDYRSKENYRSLLLESLHWLHKRGCTRVVLESWGELDMALSAYESLGFTLDEHELGYALPL